MTAALPTLAFALASILGPCVAPARAQSSEPPGPTFTDVTAASGIDFTCKGGSGRLLILDTMGSGLALADFDGDLDLDLYLLTGSQLDPCPAGVAAPTNRLFRNDGGMRFTDVTAGSGADLAGFSMGAVAGDYDGDGDLDLYVTAYGRNSLLRNDSAAGALRFTDVTGKAGVGVSRWSSGAAFLDYDKDGDLDLYVANYVDFAGRLQRFGGNLDHVDFKNFNQLPQFFDPLPNLLYRNDGDGTFTDVTAAAGVADAKGKGLGVAACDFDDDGDDDLYVANDTTPNALFQNNGDGTFDEVANEAGVALDSSGRPQGTMGIAWGDVDGDARFDLLITNFDHEPNELYRNVGGGLFDDVTRTCGLFEKTLKEVGWGCELADYDLDGDLDAFFSNGHVITDVPLFLVRHLLPADRLPGVVEPEHFDSSYRQKAQFFTNDGRGRFSDAGRSAGKWFGEEVAGRGAVSGDLDRDGDLDLVVLRSNEPVVILRNDLIRDGAPAKSAWLEVELRADSGNRFGVGARLELRDANRKGAPQIREVRCGDSYLSMHPLAQHFGLGLAPGKLELTVRWPDGTKQVLTDVKPRERLLVARGAKSGS